MINEYEIKQELCIKLNKCNEVFRPPPKQSVATWTTKNINMSTKHDSIAGPYIPFAYQLEILNCSADLSVREIIIMSSAQVGKTWMLMIIAGHRIATRPGGMVWAMDSKESVEFLSNSRFTPMYEESPVLKKLISKDVYKSAKNKTVYKDFLGGWIRFITGGSVKQLASAPSPLILADEIDKWPPTKEGDGLSLLQERTKRQVNPLLVACSTPSIKDESKIEKLYEASDKRRYYVPCCHCGKEHLLIFDNIKWDSKVYPSKNEFEAEKEKLIKEGDTYFESKITKNKLHFPDTAMIACPECGTLISDYEKNIMVSNGRWIAEKPFMGSAGFHVNEIYSPGGTLSDIVTGFLKKKDDPLTKQVFVNATLGLPWVIPHDAMKATELGERREHYYEYVVDEETGATRAPLLPSRGAILTAGVDVHLDRLEVTVRLWGIGYESWGIECLQLYGDPFQDIVWGELDSLLNKEYVHPNGMKLHIQKCAIDSGYATDRVYDFVNNRKWPAVAIKGKGGAGVPVHNGNPTHANDYKLPVYTVGVDTIKNALYQRSFINRNGPGRMHWNYSYTDRYFEQLTAERRVKKKVANGFVYLWELPPGKKNEGLDTEVYSYAALHLVGLGDMDGTIKSIIDPQEEEEKKEETESFIKPQNDFEDDL